MSTMIAQTKASAFYQQHAMSYAEISDDMRVFTLPSESAVNVSYEVRCTRTANGVEAMSCQCRDFEYRRHNCKHMAIVNKWIDRILSSICEVEAGKWYIVNSDTQVWLQNGEWVSAGPTENAIEIVKKHLEKDQEVTPVVEEPVVETPAQPVEAPKQTYRIITAPGSKRERRDLLAEMEAKREHKFELLGEIAEINDRKRSEDIGQRGHLSDNRGFHLMR